MRMYLTGTLRESVIPWQSIGSASQHYTFVVGNHDQLCDETWLNLTYTCLTCHLEVFVFTLPAPRTRDRALDSRLAIVRTHQRSLARQHPVNQEMQEDTVQCFLASIYSSPITEMQVYAGVEKISRPSTQVFLSSTIMHLHICPNLNKNPKSLNRRLYLDRATKDCHKPSQCISHHNSKSIEKRQNQSVCARPASIKNVRPYDPKSRIAKYNLRQKELNH